MMRIHLRIFIPPRLLAILAALIAVTVILH
jgi:hypothetical protein